MEPVRKLIFLALFIVLLGQSSTRNPEGEKKLSTGDIYFTESFLYQQSLTNPGISAIYSPFSLLFLLAELALYATGTSQKQLFSVLNLNSTKEIRSTIPHYLTSLNSQKNVTFELAEKVYGNIQYNFSNRFKRDTKNVFQAQAQNLDFSKPQIAAKTINTWVANKTRNLIKDLVASNSLTKDTRLVLVNAIYFKANWKIKFDKKNTKPNTTFYASKTKNTTVNMMNQIATFPYAEIYEEKAQILEIPYENGNFSFLMCLPRAKYGLKDLIKIIGNTRFSAVFDSKSKLRPTTVNLSLPSFQITTTTDLSDLLKKLNVTAIFDPSTAGLKGILQKQNPEQLFVTSAIQKAVIIVNEEGSEATAGNAIAVGVRSAAYPPPKPIDLNADHPFAYLILYQGTPIFSGLYLG